ncbi:MULTISPECIES: hypothetical protein [Bacillota]|jgi:hypothetical protein|uniref:Uncharacterized protein n=1 Tax=[Eubacterium] hominis TaxID=2764325 RepID=A0A7G9GLT3_9FIRM|nr:MULTISPECIES: hypothetical protein [Bacillota]QNM11765.1 hypothetical protein H9Q80_16180 [[Eubacterium] hominis]RGB56019.1 hypothetical protein DW271_07350 [Absiella sp. AM22-9]RGB61780.1 hypothetical protein DW120_05395 [Absiella sp. AM10-20]RGB70399.1 hypothetical protein DW113_01320 [Absiella sp. AM09-45]RGB78669.1 hypothetical protein DW114_02495 [Absiella sp. AM09-50]
MKCKECKYCHYGGTGLAGGYKCRHPKLEECAEKYEKKTNKRMTKACWYIGFKLIKTSLRYCPYKMEENENEV